MAINVSVPTQVDMDQKVRDHNRAQAIETQMKNKQQETKPAVNVLEELAIDQPDLNEVSETANEIDPQNSIPATVNPKEEFRKGPSRQDIEMRNELKRQKQERIDQPKPITSQPGWDNYQDETADAFGQSIKRADKFTKLFHDKLDDGSSVGGAWLDKAGVDAMTGFDVNITDISNNRGQPIDKYSTRGILFDKYGFNAGSINDAGQMVVDPKFSQIMGVMTEIDFENSKREQDIGFENVDQETTDQEGESLARTSGSAQLGREIFRHWKMYQNAKSGKNLNDFDESAVDQDQFEILGTLAKEMYAAANPDMVSRNVVDIPNNPLGKGVEFSLTPIGVSRIREAKNARPDAFMNQEIKPAIAPKNVVGQTYADRLKKDSTTGVVNQKQKQIEIGRQNMNFIAHVVDPKRRKIMFQLGLRALMEIEQNGTSELGELFDIGPKKKAYFEGELAKKKFEAQKNNEAFDPESYVPEKEYRVFGSKFLEALNTTAKYSNKPNHLDFVWQQLQNRMHVAQNRFNPQGNKWIRFVTGGATPDTWTVGDRSHADLMFKETIAAHFIDGADKLLPNERIKQFDQDWNDPNSSLKAIADLGKQINDGLMDSAMDKEMTDAVSQIALKHGDINIPPNVAAKIPPLNIPDQLFTKAKKKGIEGLSLIELASELDNYRRGGRMTSNVNIEFDGKTHGPASNMAMLGIMSGAYRTGILRTEGATKNLDKFTVGDILESQGIDSTTEKAAGDLREGMKQYMLDNGQAMIENVFDNEFVEPMWGILNEAVKDKVNFLKKPPMTLGYGQLLKNLRGTVETTVFSGDQAANIQKIINHSRDVLETKAAKGQTAEDVVVDFLHTIMADSINDNMDPDVIAIGQTLRANNVISILSNQVMKIENALGFDTYIGAKQRTLRPEKGQIDVTLRGKKGAVGGVPLYESKPAGSAVRDGRVGGWGRGRVIPAVVQGIDGAWMNKMFTGSTWSDMKGSYMLPIMDAVKTNLASARKIREHANRNWWNTIQEYNYVDELMGKWAPNTIKEFNAHLDSLPQDQKINIGMESDYRGFGFLLDPDGPKGQPFKNLRGFIGDTLNFRDRKKGEPIAAYENAKNQVATSIARSIMKKTWSNPKAFTELTPPQLKYFFNEIIKKLEIKERNGKTISNVKKRRNALFSKAKNSEILQIDLG